MRISFQYQAIRYHETLSSSLNSYMKAQEANTKQRTLLNPEDNPSKYITAYSIQRTIYDLGRYTNNANTANGWLTTAEIQLIDALDTISKARNDIAVKGNNGTTLDVTGYKALANEVKELYNRMMDLANSQYLDKYVFGGHETETPPFVDQKSSVTTLTQYYGEGGNITTRNAFNDLGELPSGEYVVQVRLGGGNKCYLSMIDKYGKSIMLDSNGSDDITKTGNELASELAFEFKPGMVINTGRGLSITLPNVATVEEFGGLNYRFQYTAGSFSTYFGDDGEIYNQVGYNQTIPINFPGSDLFMQDHKTLSSKQLFTNSGVSLTPGTSFYDIKGGNVSIGDTITLKGTDHLGKPLGAATALAVRSIQLDLRGTTDEERTLMFGYAGDYYQITIPEGGYASTSDLATAVNRELVFAKYAGSQDHTAVYGKLNDIENYHNYESAHAEVTDRTVDLSNQFKATLDGDRLAFVTSDVGNHTILSVTGGNLNKLGFENKTVVAVGKDTVFELGYDLEERGISNLNVEFNELSRADFAKQEAYRITVNNKDIFVEGIYADSTNADIALAFNKALQGAGFGFTVTAHVSDFIDDYGFPDKDRFNLTFTSQNTNFDRETNLAVKLQTLSLNSYKMSAPENVNAGSSRMKTIGEFMKFIEDLYGDTVKVTLKDGKMSVYDLRSGDSKMMLDIIENNQGISMPIGDYSPVLSGRYTGASSDEWIVKYNVAPGATSDTRDVKLSVVNTAGRVIAEREIHDYNGGPIDIRAGVMLTLDDAITYDTEGVPVGEKTFRFKVTPNSLLNFGDMNTISEGSSGNAFIALTNLYTALENAVELGEMRAPSAWTKPIPSTAIPSFDGIFGGNSNANWRYEVLSLDGRAEHYIQKPFVFNTGTLNYNQNLIEAMADADEAIEFTMLYFDNNSGKQESIKVTVPVTDIEGYIIINDQESLNQAILKELRNPIYEIDKKEMKVTIQNNELVFETNSGSKKVSVLTNNINTTYMMGMGKDKPKALGTDFGDIGTQFIINYFDGTDWQTANIDVKGDFKDENDLNYVEGSGEAEILRLINDQLAAVSATITASLDGSGKLFFIPGQDIIGAPIPFYYEVTSAENDALGLGNMVQSYLHGGSDVPLDMKDLTKDQRTLTFKFNGTEYNIELTPREYRSVPDVVNEINKQIKSFSDYDGDGIADLQAVVSTNGGIAFKLPVDSVTGNFVPITIEGDYTATLGFMKSGDTATIRVTDEKGSIIQNLTMDTADKYYEIADGYKLAFDKGRLFTADSFTGSVGSGVEFEFHTLDQVFDQINSALTRLGNRTSRIESVLSFNSSMTVNAQEQKSKNLGSTPVDIVDLATKVTMAEEAYKMAMTVTSRMMSISIMDFLR